MFKRLVAAISATALLILTAGQVHAVTTTVSITELPEYTRKDTFNISYSALADDPSSISAQFYYKKDGGIYSAFGSAQTGSSGKIQVTSSQINEQTKYFFKVEVTSSNGSAGDETSVTFDNSDPDPVSGYSKQKVAPGYYKLTWRNPNNSDFSRVFIYRSENTEFTADGNTKIAERGGAPDQEMSFEDIGLDTGKDYYYALRAIDDAGNPSGIVADPEVSAQPGAVEGASTEVGAGTGSEFLIMPQQESEQGEVFGEEGEADEIADDDLSPSPTTFESEEDKAQAGFLGTTVGKLSLAGAGLLLIAIAYFLLRKK